MEGRPDIGISLISDYQNKGIGPEAVSLFANRLYSDYGIQTVYVRISEENLQSQRAFAKLGAILDKTEPNHIMTSLAKNLLANNPDKWNWPNFKFYHIKLPI